MTRITLKQLETAMAYTSRVTGVPMALEHSSNGYTLYLGTPDNIESHLLTGTKSELYRALHLAIDLAYAGKLKAD